VVVILRESFQAVVLSLPEGFDDPETLRTISLGQEVIGQAVLIPGTAQLALYSTADDNDHVSILDLEGDDETLQTWALRKGVESVVPTPDGQRLLVFHTKMAGDPVPGTDTFLAQSYGYSIVDLPLSTHRLVLTEGRMTLFTFSGDGQMAFILLADQDAGVMGVEWANLATGRDETLSLRRLPQAIGVIPATAVYVSEQHEVGRMAFIDADTGEIQEVTGYHLNSRIE
jgi:hypothetical protein